MPGHGEATIELTGPMTREDIARWRGILAEGLAGPDPVRLDLAGAGPWDLAGVQLLLAAAKDGERLGRPIRLARVPEVFRAIAERAGLHDRFPFEADRN